MGDVTSIPRNPTRSRQAREIKERKMPIKREEKGLEDLKRENHRDTLYFCFLAYPLHLGKAVYEC